MRMRPFSTLTSAPASVCLSRKGRGFDPAARVPPQDLIEHGQQSLDLAEFGRPLMPVPIDRARQEPETNLLGQAGEGLGVEDPGI